MGKVTGFMEYARERLEKIEKFELKPMDVHFTISMQRHECIIDVRGTFQFLAERAIAAGAEIRLSTQAVAPLFEPCLCFCAPALS